MTDTDRETGARAPVELDPADERLVRRIDAVWRAPAQTPERRVAFQRRLDARIAASGGGGVRWPVLAATAAAGALLAVAAFVALERAPIEAPPVAVTPSEAAESGEAIFALATEDMRAEGEDDLPDEYVAIASLVIGE
jgi:hypothetical protein